MTWRPTTFTKIKSQLSKASAEYTAVRQIRQRRRDESVIHIGIDPGLHGALAVLDAAGALIRVAGLPVISDRALK